MVNDFTMCYLTAFYILYKIPSRLLLDNEQLVNALVTLCLVPIGQNFFRNSHTIVINIHLMPTRCFTAYFIEYRSNVYYYHY